MSNRTAEQPAKLAYSVPTAAEAADVGRSTLYNALKSGDLKSLKIGKRRLILPEDLLSWLKSKREEA